MTAAGDALAVGVDLGGTKIEAALVDPRGRIVDRSRMPTIADEGPDDVIRRLIAFVREQCIARAEAPVVAVGVGVAGQVEPRSGLVRFAPNLRWRDVPMGERLVAALGLPVAVLNDVQAITYGEWTCGAGAGERDMVCVFAGTGVGGGIVADGRLMLGTSGNAGEFGHITIERDGPLCTCGNRGCMEAFAGGWALARRATELAAADPVAGRALVAHAGGPGREITAHAVAGAAHAGDPAACGIVEDAGRALGVGIASIANAFNPSLVVLGGGLLDGIPEMAAIARAEVERRALGAAFAPLRFVTSELGAEAGAIGAARRARDRVAEAGPPARITSDREEEQP